MTSEIPTKEIALMSMELENYICAGLDQITKKWELTRRSDQVLVLYTDIGVYVGEFIWQASGGNQDMADAMVEPLTMAVKAGIMEAKAVI
jgi:hypothetical protein